MRFLLSTKTTLGVCARVVRGGAVDANHARTSRAFQRVGRQARALRDVPNLDFFVLENASCIEQIRVDRDAALVVQVSVCDRSSVNFSEEHSSAHVLNLRSVPKWVRSDG
jgi:hypothetical protein